MRLQRSGFAAFELFREARIHKSRGVGRAGLLSARTRRLVRGAINLRFEWNDGSEFPFLGFRDFQADGFLRLIEKDDALALGIARACSLFAMVVVVSVLVALFMLVAVGVGMFRLFRPASGNTKGKSPGQQ